MFSKPITTLSLIVGISLMASYSYAADRSEKTTNQAVVQVSDQELTRKVKDKIGPGWITSGYDQVTVQVSSGVVTLSGFVKTSADREKVERIVRNINGVVEVNNRIRVQEGDKSSKQAGVRGRETQDQQNLSKNQSKYAQDTYQTVSDQQLNKRIRDNISNGWFWDDYEDIKLTTKNGVVVIEGVVEGVNDQQKIVGEIKKIPGVKSVQSRLKIQKNDDTNSASDGYNANDRYNNYR